MFLRLERLAFVSRPLVWAALAPPLPITLLAFARLGLQRSLVRFISGRAVRPIAIGAMLSASALAVAATFLSALIPRYVPGILDSVAVPFGWRGAIPDARHAARTGRIRHASCGNSWRGRFRAAGADCADSW